MMSSVYFQTKAQRYNFPYKQK